RRVVEPLKMTSAISPPRKLLALCSPSTQRTASTMLLLPLPLGPTMAVMPAAKSNWVLSAKLLKPTSSKRLSIQSPGKDKENQSVRRVPLLGRPGCDDAALRIPQGGQAVAHCYPGLNHAEKRTLAMQVLLGPAGFEGRPRLSIATGPA